MQGCREGGGTGWDLVEGCIEKGQETGWDCKEGLRVKVHMPLTHTGAAGDGSGEMKVQFGGQNTEGQKCGQEEQHVLFHGGSAVRGTIVSGPCPPGPCPSPGGCQWTTDVQHPAVFCTPTLLSRHHSRSQARTPRHTGRCGRSSCSGARRPRDGKYEVTKP